MRGFGGDNPFGKALIMLDGRRLNRPDMASLNWLQVPVSNIERIEIVRGPGSVLYGDSAIGGVINIITKKGTAKPKANASVTVGSYGFHDEQAGVTGAWGKTSFALTGENQRTYGYRDRSRFSSQGGGLNLGYDASDKLALDMGLSFTRTDYDLPGALTKNQVEQNRRQAGNPNDDNSEKYYNANLRAESDWGSVGRVVVDFLYGQKDLTANMASWGTFNNNFINTYGVTPKYILNRDILGHGNKITLGLDYYYETLDADRYSTRERTTKTALIGLHKESMGYYVRDEFSILRELIFSAGYRTERAEIKGTDTDVSAQATIFDNKKIHSAEAYEAALTYLIGKKSKVYVKYATVYRIPFTDEQAVYSGFGADEFLQNLDKEKGKSYEAGTHFYPLENLRIGITFFRTNMEDEIVYNNATGRNENLDKTKHEGAELSLSYYIKDRGKLYGNFTYHNAEFEAGANTGKTVPLVPEVKANAGMEIYLPHNFMLRPEVRYASSAFQGGDNSNTADKVQSYTFYDLSLHYRHTYQDRTLSAFIGVENLTDEKYELILYNGYYPYPGITLRGGISFEF
jgi:iron complex outermembrane receptor protein